MGGFADDPTQRESGINDAVALGSSSESQPMEQRFPVLCSELCSDGREHFLRGQAQRAETELVASVIHVVLLGVQVDPDYVPRMRR
jgi:hypothetical protein